MRVAYIDIVSGISGDMFIGAFLGAGLPLEQLESELAKLEIGGFRLASRTVFRSMIGATKFDVHLEHNEEHHAHRGAEHEHDHRTHASIVELIDRSALSGKVKTVAKDIFRTIAEAEAKIHASEVGKVHFHEVGAVDSIVDIVGAAVCLEAFGIEEMYSSTVKTGRNALIQTQHGPMPVPAPATLEILRGCQVELTDHPYELTTPTGAAFVKTLSAGSLPGDARMEIEHVGYGAGENDIPGVPNVLRVVIGRLAPQAEGDRVCVVESNIDDMNPELIPNALEALMAAGALDAYVTPVLMKKGRPGHLLTAICPPVQREAVAAAFLRETTTIGVRFFEAGRRTLVRELRTVQTRFGEVAAKYIARESGARLVPEFEECRRISSETGLPLVEVYSQLEHDLAGKS